MFFKSATYAIVARTFSIIEGSFDSLTGLKVVWEAVVGQFEMITNFCVSVKCATIWKSLTLCKSKCKNGNDHKTKKVNEIHFAFSLVTLLNNVRACLFKTLE